MTTSATNAQLGPDFPDPDVQFENLGRGPRARFASDSCWSASAATRPMDLPGRLDRQGLAPATDPASDPEPHASDPTAGWSSSLSSLGTGRIAAVVDPENALNETFKNNNVATSATRHPQAPGHRRDQLRAQSARRRHRNWRWSRLKATQARSQLRTRHRQTRTAKEAVPQAAASQFIHS